MGRVSKYRSSMNAKAAIERKTAVRSSNNTSIPANNKKEKINTLLNGNTKNSR